MSIPKQKIILTDFPRDYARAMALYVESFKTVQEICSLLNLEERTVFHWKKEGDWNSYRTEKLKKSKMLHSKLYDIIDKLAEHIRNEIDNGSSVNPTKLYAIVGVIQSLQQIKEYEDKIGIKDNDEQGLTRKRISEIEEEVLGIKRDPAILPALSN